MPTKKISDLTAVTPLATDLVALDRPSVGTGAPITGQATLADVFTAISPPVVVTGTFNVPTPGEFVTTASVALAGGEGFAYTVDSVGTDTFFFASGSIGGKDGASPGVAVFGGDLHVSGNLTVDGTTPGGGGGLATGKQHIASYATPASTSPQVVGQFSWVPTDFTSLTSVVLRAVLATDGTTNLTGSLQVYNLTSGSFLDLTSAPTNKHLPFTGSNPTLFSSDNLLAAGTNFNNSSTSVYEVRVSGSSADTLVVGGVELVFG
jgi:hypothetical protein